MGVSFILGFVVYLAIIIAMTIWLIKHHSLHGQKAASDKNTAGTSKKSDYSNRECSKINCSKINCSKRNSRKKDPK